MYYLAVLCVISSPLIGLLLQNRLAVLAVFVNLILGCFLLYYTVDYNVIITGQLVDDRPFFAQIGDIDIFAFATKLPLYDTVIITFLVTWLLGSVYISFFYTYYELCNDYKLPEYSYGITNTNNRLLIPRISLFIMGLSILFLLTSVDTLQLIMSWFFASAVVYYCIYSQGYDASEFEVTTYASVFLLLSDALFIVGVIALTYGKFAISEGIVEFVQWDLIWLMNPLGSTSVILAVMLKSPIMGFYNLIKQALSKQYVALSVLSYGIYTNVIGTIVLLHFSDDLLQSNFTVWIAVILLVVSLISNLIKCMLDVNLNYIVTYFCLANFNYVFIVFWIKNVKLFSVLFAAQFLATLISLSLIFWLVTITESDDIRVINFNNDYRYLIIVLILMIFLPQLFIPVFVQHSIHYVIWSGYPLIIPNSLIVVLYVLLSILAFLRVFIIMQYYKDKGELIFAADASKVFSVNIMIGLVFLTLVIIQVLVSNYVGIIPSYEINRLFQITYLLTFSLLTMTSLVFINRNTEFCSNIYCQYWPWLDLFNPSTYLDWALCLILNTWLYLRLFVTKIHTVVGEHLQLLGPIFGIYDRIYFIFTKIQQLPIFLKYVLLLFVVMLLGILVSW